MPYVPHAYRGTLGTQALTRVRCSWCAKAKKAKYGEGADAPTRCYNCGKNGHVSRECPEARSMRCYVCGQEGQHGHLAITPLAVPPARLLRLLSARRVALCSSALPGWPPGPQPRPQLLERAASKVADFAAY